MIYSTGEIVRHSECLAAFTAQMDTLVERHTNRYKRALAEVARLDSVYDAEIQQEFDRMVRDAHLVTAAIVNDFHRRIIDSTQIQLAAVDAIEGKLLAYEKKFARDIHDALKMWQEDLQRTSHLREEEIQDIVQEKAVELNKCLAQNQSVILKFCLALRVEKVLKSQKERVTKFEHFRLNKWRPIRGEYLEKSFMDFIGTLRADKVGNIWEEATEIYRQCTLRQIAIADFLSSTPATELTDDRVADAQKKVEAIWQELDQAQSKSMSQLFLFDKELMNIKAEKFAELKVQAAECDYEISKQLKATMRDVSSDPDIILYRQKLEQLKAVSKSNRKLICMYCKYLIAGLTMWEQYNQQAKKADDAFKTNLQEIQNVRQNDIDNFEKEMENSLSTMSNVVDTVPVLENYMSYCQEILANLETAYQDEYTEYSEAAENYKKKASASAISFKAELQKFLKPAQDRYIAQEPSIVKQKIESVAATSNKRLLFSAGAKSAKLDNEEVTEKGADKNLAKKQATKKDYVVPDKGLSLKVIITPATLHEYRLKTQNLWNENFDSFSKKAADDIDVETAVLVSQNRNKLHQRLYDDEPRMQKIDRDIFQPRKLQLIKLKEDRFRDAEILARRIVDSRLNFHQAFIKSETTMRTFLDFVKNSMASMKASSTMQPKELNEFKSSYEARKSDCTSQIKTTLSEAEAEFKEFLEYVHEIREKATTKVTRKTATSQGRKTPSQKRKLSIIAVTASQNDENAKRELWERASAFLNEIISDSSDLVTMLMSVPERKFMQSYQPKIDHMQHEMELLCSDFDELIHSITDDIHFADETATRIQEATKKIEFEMQNFHVLAGKTQKQLYDSSDCVEKVRLICGQLKLRFDPETKKPMEQLYITINEFEKLRAMISQLAFSMTVEVGPNQRYTRVVSTFPSWVQQLRADMKGAKLFVLDSTDIHDRVSPARSTWTFANACKEEIEKTRRFLIDRAKNFYGIKNNPRDTALHARLKIPMTFEDFVQDVEQRLNVLVVKQNELADASSKDLQSTIRQATFVELPSLLPSMFDIFRQLVTHVVSTMQFETNAYLKKKQLDNSVSREQIMRRLSPHLGHPSKATQLNELNQSQVDRSDSYKKSLEDARSSLKDNFANLLTTFVLPGHLYLQEGLFSIVSGLPIPKETPKKTYPGADLSKIAEILPGGYARIENQQEGYQLPVLEQLVQSRNENFSIIFEQIARDFSQISESIRSAGAAEDRWIQSWHTAVANVRSIY